MAGKTSSRKAKVTKKAGAKRGAAKSKPRKTALKAKVQKDAKRAITPKSKVLKEVKPSKTVPKPKVDIVKPRLTLPKPKVPEESKPSAPAQKPKVDSAKPRLLSGGNPQIPKAQGDAPVQAYIAAIPDWKRDIARRLDALITRTVRGVNKAVKWNSPFYGVEGQGWFLNFHCFTNYVKVAFFRGTSLNPAPPGHSTSKNVRYFDIRENDGLDETQLAAWVKQAAALPGWKV
jgi:hypothetical protein